MSPNKKGPAAHSGRTAGGNTRDLKVDRIGQVTIYKRGGAYYLYYRESGITRRPKIDGNLAVARATAAKVAAELAEERPTTFGFTRTSPRELVAEYLDYINTVQQLSWRTQDRYRAALNRFEEFCASAGIIAIDKFDLRCVEDLVRWLRKCTRARNGHKNGKRGAYALTGIKFILSTCKTAFNWAGRRRMVPPYQPNPFSEFSADSLRDRHAEDEGKVVFTTKQQADFFAACTPWQRSIFLPLAAYGMRAGEMTHLLVEDVDLDAEFFRIRSKPDLVWRVKTSRRRELPLAGELLEIFAKAIGDRKAGFVFLSDEFVLGKKRTANRFSSPVAFNVHVRRLVDEFRLKNPDAHERDVRKAIRPFCRGMGQMPVRRLQLEFSKLTKAIGCPEFTRTHDLRHLFSSRAQEAGANPLLVQEILGHATLDMTKHYTHLGLDAKRAAIQQSLALLTGQIPPTPSE